MSRRPIDFQVSRQDQKALQQILRAGIQQVRVVLRAIALEQLTTGQTAPVVAEPDWATLEASFNEGGAHQLVGASGPRGTFASPVGLNKETMVGAGGFEPP